MTTLPQRATGIDPRSDTPEWLRIIAHKLYGDVCIRCGASRPLEVAHLVDWPGFREHVLELKNRRPRSLDIPPKMAQDLFHGPIRVVLLCSSCHTLFDHSQYTDVTHSVILALRDRALATERAALVLREYFCLMYTKKKGARNGHGYDAAANQLLDMLKDSAHAGHLPPPYSFRMPDGTAVHIRRALIEYDNEDPSLPHWTPAGFEYPAARRARATPRRRAPVEDRDPMEDPCR